MKSNNVSFNLKQLFTQYKMLALLIAIALIWGFFSYHTDGGFMTPRNLSNLMRQMAITGIVACGMSLVIIAGEIDLSVGSLLGLLGGIAAVLDVTHHLPLPLTLAVVLAVGLVIGLFNGYLTAYLSIPSFIVGLGGMLAYRGIVLGVTGGTTVAPVSDDMVYLGQGYLSPQLGVALGVVLFAVALCLVWRQRRSRARHGLEVRAGMARRRQARRASARCWRLRHHLQQLRRHPAAGAAAAGAAGHLQLRRPRRPCSAAASTRSAAIWKRRACPASTCKSIKLWIFGIMGLMCALAGLINTARLAAGSPSAGTSASWMRSRPASSAAPRCAAARAPCTAR
jgi:D-xylose transport system permease protein